MPTRVGDDRRDRVFASRSQHHVLAFGAGRISPAIGRRVPLEFLVRVSEYHVAGGDRSPWRRGTLAQRELFTSLASRGEAVN